MIPTSLTTDSDLTTALAAKMSKASNLSDVTAAATARANLGVIGEGAGGVLLGDHTFDHGAYRSNAANHAVPTSLTKAYTVPAGFIAVFQGVSIYNSGGTIVWHAFSMNNSSTPTDPDDEIAGSTGAPAGETAATFNLILDEGGTLWTYAASAGLTMFFALLLIPKPVPGGAWTVLNQKSVPTSDTAFYTVSTPGRTAMVILGHGHNRTSGNITLTTKIKRAADASPVQSGSRLYSGFATNAYSGGQAQQNSYMLNGDAIYWAATGAGLNLSLLICERTIAGV